MKVIKLKLALWFSFAFLFSGSKCYCQEQIDSSLIVKFLQQNTDTTIIFYYPTSAPEVRYTDQLIISKIDSGFVYSTYINPYKNYSHAYKLSKDSIGIRFTREERKFERTIPDTNQFYLPKKVNAQLQKIYWNKLLKYAPWKLNDSLEKGIENKSWVYDAGGICLLLITKNEIKKLNFYDPWDFIKCISNNVNRESILKIEKIFNDAFK